MSRKAKDAASPSNTRPIDTANTEFQGGFSRQSSPGNREESENESHHENVPFDIDQHLGRLRQIRS